MFMKEYENPVFGIKRLITAEQIVAQRKSGFPLGTYAEGVYYPKMISPAEARQASEGHKKGIKDFEELNRRINKRILQKAQATQLVSVK